MQPTTHSAFRACSMIPTEHEKQVSGSLKQLLTEISDLSKRHNLNSSLSLPLSLLKLLILFVMQLKYFAVRFLMLLCVSTVCYFWLSFRNQLSGTGFCLQFTTLTKQITSCHIPPSQLSHSTQHSVT